MKFIRRNTFPILLITLLTSCYSVKWVDNGLAFQHRPAPQSIQEAFGPEFKLSMSCSAPGKTYAYDIAEKDDFYDSENKELVFTSVDMYLHQSMPEGQVLVDVIFRDNKGHYLEMPAIDLMRIVPTLDTEGLMAYPEYLLEEFSRFGISLRKEHGEYNLKLNGAATEAAKDAADRAYRANLVNNCLDPTKWEMQLNSEDFSDFSSRVKSKANFNQVKALSHSWFFLDARLYRALLELKNGDRGDLFDLSYDDLSTRSEEVVVDLSQLREEPRKTMKTKILEIGFQSEREIEPVDLETYYKKQFGLLGSDTVLKYSTIGDHPRKLAKFEEEGFYNYQNANVYDFSYVNTLEYITVKLNETSNSNCHIEITLDGSKAPYRFRIGNIDLALLDEQKMLGIGLGINPYPKSRRYNPQQATISYDPDYFPSDKKPYALMTDTNNEKWVNNQFKGVEKVFLSYKGIDDNILEIYLLSYEREIPIWMARVQLSPHIREMVRARRNLYNY